MYTDFSNNIIYVIKLYLLKNMTRITRILTFLSNGNLGSFIFYHINTQYNLRESCYAKSHRMMTETILIYSMHKWPHNLRHAAD